MSPARFWRDMPSSAFGDHAKDWIAVLPVAAIEQHGPHLPVGVDAIVAEGMVARAAAALPADLPVTFLPVEEVCKSNEHIAFPGTLTLDWDVVIRTWVQIGESVARAGVRTLVIVTSHGGNVPPMEIAARELRQRLGMRAVTTAWGRLGSAAPKPQGLVIDIHAGQAETSWMLALRPDLVDMSKAGDFRSAQERVVDASGRLGYHMMAANMAWLSQDLNPAGAVGNAAAATAEAGEADIAAMVEGFVALMRDLTRLPPP
jgi:creatinine amidohydrolase